MERQDPVEPTTVEKPVITEPTVERPTEEPTKPEAPSTAMRPRF